MKRLLCLIGMHRWQPMKWGYGSGLDCRECVRCGRFEIVAFGGWVRMHRDTFPDAHAWFGS